MAVARTNLLDVVSEVYYINLADASDLDRFMQTQLGGPEQESGQHYHRFSAASGRRNHSARLMRAPFKDGQGPAV